jgi:hypothetical protein
MTFRKRLFAVLAVICLVWMIYVIAFYGGGGAENEALSAEANTGLNAVAGSVWLCITLPFFALFSLLAWRNSVGLRSERQHREHIEALAKGKLP